MVHQVVAILVGGVARRPAIQAEHVTVEKEELGGASLAQPGGVLDDGVEHRSGIGDVPAEGREDLAAGRGLVARVPQLLVWNESLDVRAVRSFGSVKVPPITDLLTVCA